MNTSRRTIAADRLEAIAAGAHIIIATLRDDDVSDELAYALVYELRKRVGYVVRDMGAGVAISSETRNAIAILDDCA